MKFRLLLTFLLLFIFVFPQEKAAHVQTEAVHKAEKMIQFPYKQDLKANKTAANRAAIQNKQATKLQNIENDFKITPLNGERASNNLISPVQENPGISPLLNSKRANSGSPAFESVKGKPEVISKRNMYSKTFDNGDGSFTALVGAGPLHYEKNGRFLDIDLSITVNFDQSYPYVNADNLFQSYFGATSSTGVKNKTDDGELREFLNTKMYWEVNGQPYGMVTSANVPVQIDDNKAYYRNIYGSIDAEFTVLTGKRELNYIIPNKQALGLTPANAQYLVFSEDVVLPLGWTHQITKEGIVIKNAMGEFSYMYPNPISKDAGATPALLGDNNTIYETHLTGSTLTIKTKVKTSWLLDSEREYPIKVDPVTFVEPEFLGFAWTGWSSSVGGNIPTVVAGRRSGGQYMGGFAKFDLESIPGGSEVNDVLTSFYYYAIYGGYGGNRTVRLVDINVDPVETVPVSIAAILASSTLTNVSDDFEPINGSAGDRLHLFNAFGKSFVEGNIAQGWTAVSLYPRGTNWTTNNEASFYGNDHPVYLPIMIIDYTLPATCEPRSFRDPAELYINDVKFFGGLNPNDVENLNNGYDHGYQNWTTLPDKPRQAQGQVINMHLRANFIPPNIGWRGVFKAWVDWNKDGVFQSTERVYTTNTVMSNIGLFGFVIPSGRAPGDYRIRVRLQNSIFFDDNSNDAYELGDFFDAGPCDDYINFPAILTIGGTDIYGEYVEYGETEDYLFEVVQDCPSSRIADINTGSGHGLSCGPGQVTLSAEAVVHGGGTTYKWYDAKHGGTLLATNSGQYTTGTLTPGTYTYWVTAVTSGCETVERYPVTAVVNDLPKIDLEIDEGEICGDESNIKISSTGDLEEVSLVDENFNGSTNLGLFKNVASTPGYGTTNWANRPNPYNVNFPMYKPAMSSGYYGGRFAVSITDANVSRYEPISTTLELRNSVSAADLTDLKLDFDLYFQTYLYTSDAAEEYFSVEVYDGSTWNQEAIYLNTVGNPGGFVKQTIDLSAYDGEPDLKIRFINYSHGDSNGTIPTIAAVDNIRLYGMEEMLPEFSWTAPGITIYEVNCSSPVLVTDKKDEICLKPTEAQLEANAEWVVTATGTLANGCSVSENITVTNMTKIWNTTASTDWSDDANRWKPVAVSAATTDPPTADNCVIVKQPVNVLSGTHGLGKNLKVKDSGQIHIKGGASVTITDFIKSSRDAEHFVVETDGNLLQINDLAEHTADIRAERALTNILNDFDNWMHYIYWSAPITGQNLRDFSPGTPPQPEYWAFLEYNESTDFFDNTGDTNFLVGKGYAIRAEDYGGVPYSETYAFEGNLNNGVIPYGITHTRQGFNLVGNPYPSDIDVQKLFDGNSNIHTTAFFWTNDTDYEQYQEGPDYSGNNYAIFNGTGGTPATTTGTEMNAPNGFVKVGQGFIVQKTAGGAGNDLTFRNDMRVTTATRFYSKELKDRFWLTLHTPDDILNTTLIGYIDGATDGYEADYDAEFWGASDAIYSLIPDRELIIQGRQSPLNINDVVPLGVKVHTDGVHVIRLEQPEGEFTQVRVYLIDKELGYSHNLSKEPYKFFAFNGTNHDRFEIRYRKAGFSTSADANLVTAARQKEDIIILSTLENIREVQLFDILGMEVYQNLKVDGKELRIPAARWMNSILFAKIITEDGEVTTTKVLLK